MKVIRLETLFLRHRPATERTVAQDEFSRILQKSSESLGHWDNDIQWSVAESLEEGTQKIAAQLRQYYRGKLQQLGLEPADLQFTVIPIAVNDGLFWPSDRQYATQVFSAAAGGQ